MRRLILCAAAVLAVALVAWPSRAAQPAPAGIRAYDLDFNWGGGGPNGFARPGLWADADPAKHVAWYKALGANVIQSFCVSCNGYAWYKHGVVPEQPGLKQDFLPDCVRLAHREGILVLGYFCAGSNTRWGREHPDLSYGIPSEPHIPYTDEYLTYLDAAVRDAVTKTGIDGFMLDWLRMPTSRASNGGRWLACEKKLYTQLMGEPFPGGSRLPAAKMTEYGRRAVGRCWDTVRRAAKAANPDCIVWLTCCDVNDPHIVNSRALRETDWLLNEAGDQNRTADAKRMIGPHTRLITCLANWNGQDPTKIVPAALREGIGLYGFARPGADSLLPLETYLSRPVAELHGDARNIAALARAYHGASLDAVWHDGRFVEPKTSGLIPAPAKCERLAGTVMFDTKTVLVCDTEAAKAEAETLAAFLRPATGLPLLVVPSPPLAGKLSNAIRFTIDPTNKPQLGDEGYRLEVLPAPLIRITAATPAGLFYGGQTLRQLLLPAVYAATRQTGVKWTIPCCRIEDRPRFAWRGLMLDASRHFQSAAEVRRWLDLLAMHKLNVFHWHLVDDHGWRFESKKYPLLTQVGAWREQPPVGRYGGYYTQAEMRELVAYAAARHITIVPEIEMPGHSRAAIAAYPHLACGALKTEVDHFFDFPMGATVFPSVPGSNVLCAGKETTYRFLEEILGEVIDIFPSQYIHVGGDEVDGHWWNQCADCRAMMKQHHLANPQRLEAYLMARIEKFLNAHGRKLIGWDEILEGGLSPGATVMSWRGTSGGLQAARAGHDAVMSPGKPLYFDHRQSNSPLHPPGFGGAVETLAEVYQYEPVPAGLSPAEARHILGAQANLWTCATNTQERLELQAFPRLCALAEATWCESGPKDYAAFAGRLEEHLKRLDTVDAVYWREPDTLEVGHWKPDAAWKTGHTLELPLRAGLTAGAWSAQFQYHRGADALFIDRVALLADGAPVSVDSHRGIAGSRHVDHIYRLTLPAANAGRKLALRITAHVEPWAQGGNGDTTGVITMTSGAAPRLFAPERPLPAIRATTADVQNRDHATYDWPTRHRQVLEHFKAVKPDVVMIGDSITHYWGGRPTAPIARSPDKWQKAFGARVAANLGFGWDRTENVLWRIAHGELDGISPKHVVLLMGTNNLGIDSVDEVFQGIDAVCRAIHAKLPTAKILVLGILPRRDQAGLKADLDRVNYLLETRLHPRGYVRVVDFGNKFRNADGSICDRLFSDGLHPSVAGYELLASLLAEQIKE
jgi:hexosaminidase